MATVIPSSHSRVHSVLLRRRCCSSYLSIIKHFLKSQKNNPKKIWRQKRGTFFKVIYFQKREVIKLCLCVGSLAPCFFYFWSCCIFALQLYFCPANNRRGEWTAPGRHCLFDERKFLSVFSFSTKNLFVFFWRNFSGGTSSRIRDSTTLFVTGLRVCEFWINYYFYLPSINLWHFGFRVFV